MRFLTALLLIGACISAPGALAAERFVSDKPTPLQRLKPGKDDGTTVRFAGSVQLPPLRPRHAKHFGRGAGVDGHRLNQIVFQWSVHRYGSVDS